MARATTCHLIDEATTEFAAWAERLLQKGDFAAQQQLSRRLGAHPNGDRAEFGFWVPELNDQPIDTDSIFLEIFTPLGPIDYGSTERAQFQRDRVPVTLRGDYIWAVLSGLRVGNRDSFGSFYQLVYAGAEGKERVIYDPLAYSLPFGVYAPAELYDFDRLDFERHDRDYFRRRGSGDDEATPRFGPPTNILQLHVPTATQAGTLKGLAGLYEAIAQKIEQGELLTPTEQNYVGYDAVQLMPVEPVIEYEDDTAFWRLEPASNSDSDDSDDSDDTVSVTLAKLDMTNWGYDVVIAGSSAVNPVLLETGRPDELADFAAVLHNFPGKPIQLIFDVVYGHADNQGLKVLNGHYFSGPNMYGQDLNYQHRVVRAILLEMQRRKVNFGADGVRVDGAQDFKYWDAKAHELKYDDLYLQQMSDTEQEVADARYLPWMIFEDGRPWPREDWETASTYRAVIAQQPHTFQWGPLTFAHNTPHLNGFWNSKWWRIEEIVSVGAHWISGCANHDTMRRGYQIDLRKPINPRMGRSLFEIMRRSYDHPAASLLTYGLFPGVPMEFVHATMHAPWAFIRNTDYRYSIKVVAEEAGFLDWQVDEHHFHQDVFPRLKKMGFEDLSELRRFATSLLQAVVDTEYDLDAIVMMLDEADPPLAGPEPSITMLRDYARAFMDDLHEYCNAMRFAHELNPEQTSFNLRLRNFRRSHPWLMENLRDNEGFSRIVYEDGSTLFYGLRTSPDESEQVLFVANMEGEPITLSPLELDLPTLEHNGWRFELISPNTQVGGPHEPLTLTDAEGVLLYRQLS
ncbi:MAG: glucosylglycerol hydrolase [Trueperaceae bacterium]|nr:glucosylglycerol hydrolase [Trueperaceae bacterium]